MNTPEEILVISGAGAVILAVAGWPIFKTKRAGRWPRTKATVIESKVVHLPSDGEGRSQPFRVEVAYRYDVKGTSHECRRLSYFAIGKDHRYKANAEQQRKRYARGSKIEIRYDPRNPGDAIADRRVPSAYYFAATLGLIFLAGGLITVLRQSLASGASGS
ncbi:MAG: DUF3592 domain-containing protein [Bryobacteraceae bacterium]